MGLVRRWREWREQGEQELQERLEEARRVGVTLHPTGHFADGEPIPDELWDEDRRMRVQIGNLFVSEASARPEVFGPGPRGDFWRRVTAHHRIDRKIRVNRVELTELIRVTGETHPVGRRTHIKAVRSLKNSRYVYRDDDDKSSGLLALLLIAAGGLASG